jgi:glycosyltransferase involved in cell wall biosynthesis
MLTYDCEAFVAAAIDSMLAQDYQGPLEIVISDDASSDRTFAVTRDLLAGYRGPRRVIVRQRRANSGSKSAHLNDAFSACTGELLVSFDGDDVSVPTRVSLIVARFVANPRVQSIYSAFALMGAAGRRERRSRVTRPLPAADPAEWFARVDAYAAGATLAVRRAVVETFGPLDGSLNEDVQLPFRAALIGDVEFIDEPLVRVRRHAGSFTADWERYRSVRNYTERMVAGIETASRARIARRADIDTAERMLPASHLRWDRLRSVVERSFHEAEMTRALVSEAMLVRLRGLLALARVGAYKAEFAQHAFLAIAPHLYLSYRRLRLGLAAKKSGPATREGGA